MNWNYYANFPREQKLQAIIWMRWRIINSKCCWSMWNFLCPLLKTTTKWNKKIWEVNARNTSTDFCPRVTKTNWDADETLLSAKPLSWRNKLHYCSHPSWYRVTKIDQICLTDLQEQQTDSQSLRLKAELPQCCGFLKRGYYDCLNDFRAVSELCTGMILEQLAIKQWAFNCSGLERNNQFCTQLSGNFPILRDKLQKLSSKQTGIVCLFMPNPKRVERHMHRK